MKSWWNFLRKVARCERGTASLEAVIVLPVAISLMAGGIEFGRILSASATVDKSMRAAVRYLVQVPNRGVCTWGLANARNIAVYGQMTSGTPLLPGWTPGMVTLVNPPNCGAEFPDPTVIELRADVPFTVNMLGAVGITNSFTLTGRHQERHLGDNF